MSATQSNNLPLWVQNRETVIEHSADAQWRGNNPPDYAESVENLAKESLKNHPAGFFRGFGTKFSQSLRDGGFFQN